MVHNRNCNIHVLLMCCVQSFHIFLFASCFFSPFQICAFFFFARVQIEFLLFCWCRTQFWTVYDTILFEMEKKTIVPFNISCFFFLQKVIEYKINYLINTHTHTYTMERKNKTKFSYRYHSLCTIWRLYQHNCETKEEEEEEE